MKNLTIEELRAIYDAAPQQLGGSTKSYFREWDTEFRLHTEYLPAFGNHHGRAQSRWVTLGTDGRWGLVRDLCTTSPPFGCNDLVYDIVRFDTAEAAYLYGIMQGFE
jgi:hypothetical protein